MNAAVIVAAGRGTRMGLERNKVLAPLCGEPVIARTVRAFEQTGWFDGGIVVVTGACDADEMKRILADGGLHAQVVLGGADRQAGRGENYGNQGNGAPGPVRKCRSAACATSGARPAAARHPMCAATPRAAMFPARSGGTRPGRRRRWPRAPARRSGRG